MEAQRKLVYHMENKVNELWLRLDYCTEKNRQGKKYDGEEGGRNLATVKTFGVSAKERPLEGTSERNNYGYKAPDNPDEMDNSIGQEQEQEE